MVVVTDVSRSTDNVISYLSLTLVVCVALVLRGSYNLGSLDYLADRGLDSSDTGGKVAYIVTETTVG